MRSEIEQPTPYNTYVIDGLPPGPIANPGRASLEAAANPARTKELFFVADGTGGHAFADNYEQHQKNVARLRALEQQANPQPRRSRNRPRSRRRARRGPPRRSAHSRRSRFALRARACALRSRAISHERISDTMALSSMTGFARGHGVTGAYAWAGRSSRSTPRASISSCGCRRAGTRSRRRCAARAAEVLSRGTVFANLTREPRGRRAGGAHQRAGAGGGAGDAQGACAARSTPRRRRSTASWRSRA